MGYKTKKIDLIKNAFYKPILFILVLLVGQLRINSFSESKVVSSIYIFFCSMFYIYVILEKNIRHRNFYLTMHPLFVIMLCSGIFNTKISSLLNIAVILFLTVLYLKIKGLDINIYLIYSVLLIIIFSVASYFNWDISLYSLLPYVLLVVITLFKAYKNESIENKYDILLNSFIIIYFIVIIFSAYILYVTIIFILYLGISLYYIFKWKIDKIEYIKDALTLLLSLVIATLVFVGIYVINVLFEFSSSYIYNYIEEKEFLHFFFDNLFLLRR